jgi:hypothetical protein
VLEIVGLYPELDVIGATRSFGGFDSGRILADRGNCKENDGKGGIECLLRLIG